MAKIVACFQTVSKPLLVLSIATAFTEESEFTPRVSDDINNSDARPGVHSEVSSVDSTSDTR